MGDSVLITGAGGFVGQAVARHLRSRGYRIVAASRSPAALSGMFEQTRQMPSKASGRDAWAGLLDDIGHVVHCAGIAHADRRVPETAYVEANVRLTEELALASARRLSGKFIFLSSIRAICGPISTETVSARTLARPQDAYGRSKLQAEGKLRAAFSGNDRFTILRPVLIYGPQPKGNLGALMRLARLPLPLPAAGLSARRSLLDVASCAQAVEHVLENPGTNGETYIVSDAAALSIAEILTAFRRGYGRRPLLFDVSPVLLSALFAIAGKGAAWQRLSGPLVADPSALAAAGWQPVADSRPRLEELASRAR